MTSASGRDLRRPGAGADLVDILVASLDRLAAAGQADAACRLAGQACATLRLHDPKGWGRFNALLHRLARRLDRPPGPRDGPVCGSEPPAAVAAE